MAKEFYGSLASESDVAEFFESADYHSRPFDSDVSLSDLVMCGLCGAIVVSESRHREFHVNQARLLNLEIKPKQ